MSYQTYIRSQNSLILSCLETFLTPITKAGGADWVSSPCSVNTALLQESQIYPALGIPRISCEDLFWLKTLTYGNLSPGPQRSPVGAGRGRSVPPWTALQGFPGRVQVVAVLGRFRMAQTSFIMTKPVFVWWALGEAHWGWGSGSQQSQPEVGVALDKAQGSRSWGLLSLSSLSSSTNLSPSIFHKTFFTILPEELGECR